MYLTIIGSRLSGFSLLCSTTGTQYEYVFNTYNQCKHFVGFWNKNGFPSKHFMETYEKWEKLYFNKDDRFIGNFSDFNTKECSLIEEPIYRRIFTLTF